MPTIISRGSFSGKAFGLTSQTAAPVYVEDVFSTYLYTGNGSTQTITNNIDLSTKGGLVWLKNRTGVYGHWLWDTSRGAGYSLNTNSTGGEGNIGTTEGVSFTSSGFSMGNNINWNGSGISAVSWTFREQPKFFDIVQFVGNGASSQTINHNLGAAPGMIIVKNLTTGSDWWIYHTSLGNDQALRFSTDAAASLASNSWAATSSSFNALNYMVTNTNGQTYVAYLFANQAGGFGLSGTDSIVACGSCNMASANVNLGWEPQYLLFKKSSGAGSWYVADNMRGVASGVAKILYPNATLAETTDSPNALTFNATGFSTSGYWGTGTYVYLAIRRGPMKIPTDATKVFNPQVVAGSSSYSVGFPTDFCLAGDQSGNALNTVAVYRLAGNSAYFGGTASTAAEQSASVCRFDLQNSFQLSYNSNNQARWHFQRAPSFMDVVCYSGFGDIQDVLHNLTVVPELIIVKPRSASGAWVVGTVSSPYVTYFDATMFLNTSAASVAQFTYTSPLPGVSYASFTVINRNGGTAPDLNIFGVNYVAYLFATCAGVSKVGSYTGTGAAQNIACGFSAGARFVLIKRTDSTGDWYVYDSARGISSGNDPYLLMNSTAAQVTGTDYVNTHAAGFALTASAPAALNASGGSYIFLAIA